MADAADFLKEAAYDKHPAFFTKDSKIGDTLAGTIVDEPRVVSTPDLNTKEPTDKLVIVVEDADGKKWALWCQKALAAAVGNAVKAATDGGTKVEEGAKLAVTFSGVGTPSQPGYNPPKQWKAEYQPAARSVDAGSLFQS